jgi:hypothetical protein
MGMRASLPRALAAIREVDVMNATTREDEFVGWRGHWHASGGGGAAGFLLQISLNFAVTESKYFGRHRKPKGAIMKMRNRVFLASAALLIGTAAASAQSGVFYGPQGQYRGRYYTNGDTTTVYGPQGQYRGMITQDPQVTVQPVQPQVSSPQQYMGVSPPAPAQWGAPCVFC